MPRNIPGIVHRRRRKEVPVELPISPQPFPPPQVNQPPVTPSPPMPSQMAGQGQIMPSPMMGNNVGAVPQPPAMLPNTPPPLPGMSGMSNQPTVLPNTPPPIPGVPNQPQPVPVTVLANNQGAFPGSPGSSQPPAYGQAPSGPSAMPQPAVPNPPSMAGVSFPGLSPTVRPGQVTAPPTAPRGVDAPPARMLIEIEGKIVGEVRLNKPILTIGRQSGRDILVSDKRVSRHHARVIVEQGAWVIEDAESVNGLVYKGERIKRRTLSNGDSIYLAPDVLLRYEVVPEPGR
ncbi:MAG: FHA domain-containing protein [Ktedonobacteraceae bacterium]|nr:FHA domain-containing protein [Ktedonobacteraceae bacterium]